MQDDKEVKKLVNRIFGMKGLPKVTNFAQEFSDGSKCSPPYFSLLSHSQVLAIVQHIVRREHWLPTCNDEHGRGPTAKLEPNQRCDLFQLSAARILPSWANYANPIAS